MSLNLRIYIPCQESSQQTLCHESKLEFQKIEAVQVWLQPDEWILQSVIFNEEIEASKELIHFSIFPASQQFLYIRYTGHKISKGQYCRNRPCTYEKYVTIYSY